MKSNENQLSIKCSIAIDRHKKPWTINISRLIRNIVKRTIADKDFQCIDCRANLGKTPKSSIENLDFRNHLQNLTETF